VRLHVICNTSFTFTITFNLTIYIYTSNGPNILARRSVRYNSYHIRIVTLSSLTSIFFLDSFSSFLTGPHVCIINHINYHPSFYTHSPTLHPSSARVERTLSALSLFHLISFYDLFFEKLSKIRLMPVESGWIMAG